MTLFTIEAGALEGFGKKVQLKQMISLEKAINDFKNIESREIVIKGVVKDVCVKKGCWMTLNNDNESVRVTFKDYGFFVPASLKSKNITRLFIFDIYKYFINFLGNNSQRYGQSYPIK